MIPVKFPESNATLASTQDEYEPLPVYVFPGLDRRMAFCCRLSDAEVDQIVATRTLWLQQLTFGNPFQPILLSVEKPDDIPPQPPINPYKGNEV
jgi:hypothetical protein